MVPMAAITVKTADKDNAIAQYKTKWPISLVSVLKPLINSRHWEDVLETSIIPVTDVYKPSLHHLHIEHLLWYTYLRERSVPGFCVTVP